MSKRSIVDTSPTNHVGVVLPAAGPPMPRSALPCGRGLSQDQPPALVGMTACEGQASTVPLQTSGAVRPHCVPCGSRLGFAASQARDWPVHFGALQPARSAGAHCTPEGLGAATGHSAPFPEQNVSFSQGCVACLQSLVAG